MLISFYFCIKIYANNKYLRNSELTQYANFYSLLIQELCHLPSVNKGTTAYGAEIWGDVTEPIPHSARCSWTEIYTITYFVKQHINRQAKTFITIH